eukprot:jgi/Mesvir1/12186/Mv00424-RA.1
MEESYGSHTVQDERHDAYLSELLSYSLDRLNKEPELLRADGERIQGQMQEVAVAHYRAFITSAECVHVVREEMTRIGSRLDHLVEYLPELTKGCESFVEDANQILAARKLNRVLLANHGPLLDLLEIPQLMDTCVRNGNYDEALDLEALVAKLATMHSSLAVIRLLAVEVGHTTQLMLSQLLQRLRSNIQLPECLRVVGYLRRLAVFDEYDMRLQFLRCRESWLSDIIEDLDKSSPYDYLKRVTDAHRVHLFDVVMQYRAIFADDTSAQEDVAKDCGMLYSWATHRICTYLDVLRATLPSIAEGGSLASVLEHCMYCGLSLGRVGLDFRGLLPPLFETCILNLFTRNMALAVDSFKRVLDLHSWSHVPGLSSSLASTRTSSGMGGGDDLSPPYVLMEHPPLATFVNGVLAALNELRHCAPIGIRVAIGATLQTAVADVSKALERSFEMLMLKEPAKQLFVALCKALVEIACPYIATCFSRTYPGSGTLLDLAPATQPVVKIIGAHAAPEADKHEREEVRSERDEEDGEEDAGEAETTEAAGGGAGEVAEGSKVEGDREGQGEKGASAEKGVDKVNEGGDGVNKWGDGAKDGTGDGVSEVEEDGKEIRGDKPPRTGEPRTSSDGRRPSGEGHRPSGDGRRPSSDGGGDARDGVGGKSAELVREGEGARRSSMDGVKPGSGSATPKANGTAAGHQEVAV